MNDDAEEWGWQESGAAAGLEQLFVGTSVTVVLPTGLTTTSRTSKQTYMLKIFLKI